MRAFFWFLNRFLKSILRSISHTAKFISVCIFYLFLQKMFTPSLFSDKLIKKEAIDLAEIEEILKRYDDILSDNDIESPLTNGKENKIYTVSNFRGGIGKTTLSFNIAYKFAKSYRSLFVDVCPQRNYSELLLGTDINNFKPTIYDALIEKVMGGAWESESDAPLSRRVRDSNKEFENLEEVSHVIPGSTELFLFSSTLYSQLNQFYSMRSSNKQEKGVANLLNSLKSIIDNESRDLKTEKVLIDTSPFFGGATHLAWMAADAIIIPVRVDEQSLFALELTLKMLHDDSSDFNIWRKRAGITKKAKVQAIAVTHCGWNRQSEHQIDGASRMYIDRAVSIANEYGDCFTTDNPVDHFALLSDFQGSGKISGSLGIPIENLTSQKFFTVDGKRLQVNKSVERYKKELNYLFKLID